MREDPLLGRTSTFPAKCDVTIHGGIRGQSRGEFLCPVGSCEIAPSEKGLRELRVDRIKKVVG